MASKKAKSSKTKGAKKAGKGGVISKLGNAAQKAISGGGSKGGGGGKRRSKSPAWYARKIATLKLKRRYDKLRLAV